MRGPGMSTGLRSSGGICGRSERGTLYDTEDEIEHEAFCRPVLPSSTL